ncbi:MAG: hypothetical protein MJB14_18965, partial [Spirochaetes bacterium]|nr:hypothetical protein [Spirochaetota bacterium]
DGTIYDLNNHPDYTNIKDFIWDLSLLNEKEGQIRFNISVEDFVGNPASEEYIYNLDAKKPELTINLNSTISTPLLTKVDKGEKILLNGPNMLNIAVNDLNYVGFDCIITSDYAGSLNVENIVGNTSTDYDVKIIEKSLPVTDYETLFVQIKAYDSNGNESIYNKTFELYSDFESPEINCLRLEEGKYNIAASDSTLIKDIHIKYIDLPADLDVDLDDFTPTPPGDRWLSIAKDIKTVNKNFNIMPQYAACVFAEDIWGNLSDSSSVGIFMENQLPESYYIINSKADLDAVGWTLYGMVLFKTSITVEAGEVLNITTNLGNATRVDFDALLGQFKIINNGGEVNFISDQNEIQFSSGDFGDRDYGWFGFQNLDGNFNFTGTNRIKFINAVAGLSYLNPDSDINLSNLDFADCFMGIHFIDENLNFNLLNLDFCHFTDSIYGIKFDLHSYEDSEIYDAATAHLNRTNCSFTNISKGNVYCPVEGILD